MPKKVKTALPESYVEATKAKKAADKAVLAAVPAALAAVGEAVFARHPEATEFSVDSDFFDTFSGSDLAVPEDPKKPGGEWVDASDAFAATVRDAMAAVSVDHIDEKYPESESLHFKKTAKGVKVTAK